MNGLLLFIGFLLFVGALVVGAGNARRPQEITIVVEPQDTGVAGGCAPIIFLLVILGAFLLANLK